MQLDVVDEDEAVVEVVGVGKIARIVLKLFASESEWEDYWRKRMDLNQSVMLNFKVLEVR